MPNLTAREYQKLVCPACGERKDPEQPRCAPCRQRQVPRNDLCPDCRRPKPAHYQRCADCQVEHLMRCPQCGGRKAHPDRPLCASCYAAKKYGAKARCACPCGCDKYKTKPRAPVCGLCWQQGHYHQL